MPANLSGFNIESTTPTTPLDNPKITVIGSIFGDFTITEETNNFLVLGPSGVLAKLWVMTNTTPGSSGGGGDSGWSNPGSVSTDKSSVYQSAINIVLSKIESLSADYRGFDKQLLNTLVETMTDSDKGIVTRFSSNPPRSAWKSEIDRAMTIIALRNVKTLNEVINEVASPTVIPEFQEPTP